MFLGLNQQNAGFIGGLASVDNSLTATVSPTARSATCSSFALCVATTTSATCTASNGTAPYIYSWQRVSGDTFTTITSPTMDTTTFSNVVDCGGGAYVAVFVCVVTDANGVVTTSNSVTVTTQNTSPGPCT